MKNTKRHFFIIDFAKSIKNFDYYKEIADEKMRCYALTMPIFKFKIFFQIGNIIFGYTFSMYNNKCK